MLLLILSLAGIKLVWKSDELCVIFALDVSNSVSSNQVQRSLNFITQSLEGMRENDTAGLVVFGKEAFVEFPPGKNLNIRGISSEPDKEYTNIASAIATSAELFPDSVQKRIILLSDGNENSGSAGKDRIAEASNIQIYTVPLQTIFVDRKEALIENLLGPGVAYLSRVFSLRAIIRSNYDGLAKLKLFRDRSFVAEKAISLSANDKTIVEFRQALESDGSHIYEVMIEPFIDTSRENNRAETIVRVIDKPKVLYVSSESRPLMLQILKESKEIELVKGPILMPASLSELQDYNAIIFDNIPSDLVSVSQMEKIRSYIHELGGGFIMIGGENSFGAGGYNGTPIEDILPVKLMPEQKKRSLSLILAIDRSGSMAALSGRFSKIDLAKDAAISVIDLLTDRDQLGIISFDAKSEEIVRLGKIMSKADIESMIATIRPKGGTNIYPALSMAYNRLKDVDTQLKHVILLSDGRSLQTKESYELVKRMARESITISTVTISEDADKDLMREISRAGMGRYYETSDAGSLPRIFAKETLMASRLIMEGDFQPIISGYSDILRGIDYIPHLRGYVGTSPKEGSSIIIKSDQEDPILSLWQYGLGKVLAFTSDAKPKWASDWMNWQNFSKFWSQAVDWSISAPSYDLDITANIMGGKGNVIVDAIDKSGQYRNFLDLQASVVRPDLTSDKFILSRTGQGRYESEFQAGQSGGYSISIREMEDGKTKSYQTTEIISSYSREYSILDTNYDFLKNIAASTYGRFEPKPDDVFIRSSDKVLKLKDFWRILAIISIPLFFLDIAIRRVALTGEQVSSLKARLSRNKAIPTEEILSKHRQAITDIQIAKSDTSIEIKKDYAFRLMEAKKRVIKDKD